MQFGLLWRVLTAVCLLGGGGLWVGTEAAALSTTERPPQEAVSADDVLLRAEVRPDGTADWRIEYRTSLDDPATARAFENLSASVERDPTPFADRFERRMTGTVAAAGNATGREMSVANVSVTAETRELPRSYGVVAYEFEWRGFAVRDGDRLVAADALAGLFLDDGEALVVTWPEGYALSEATPPPDERRPETREVVWNGPEEFGPGAPSVAVEPPGGPLSGVGGPVAVAAGVALAALVAGGVLLARRGSLPVVSERRSARTEADGGAGRVATARPATTSERAAAESDDDGDAVGPPESVPVELLSNEERVVRALRENGGRMRQQALVAELGWTDAKTSQVVGRLREDGDVESFRIGRENVLTLPGERL